MLHRHALELDVTIRVNSRAVDYNMDAPAITFVGGDVVQPDLVVAMDGMLQWTRATDQESDHDLHRYKSICEDQAHRSDRRRKTASHRNRCLSARGRHGKPCGRPRDRMDYV